MQGANHAIRVGAIVQGWTWELIDSEGVTTAEGYAADQDSAMASAWRAARSYVKTAPDEYPDVVVGHADGDQRPLRR
jgi:hypothetical protein